MSLAVVGYVFEAAAAVATVATAVSSAKAQKKAGEERQAALDMQAAISEKQAKQTERQGASREDIARTRLRRLLASQRALYAKAGVDLSSGSPLTMLASTASEGEIEALTIRKATKEQADSLREGAGLLTFGGAQAKAAGKVRATGTLLSGLGSAAGQGYSAYKGWSNSPKK